MNRLRLVLFLGATVLALSAFGQSVGLSRQVRPVNRSESASRFNRFSLQTTAPWPKFHNTNSNTGLGSTGGSNGILLWSYTTANFVQSSPAVGSDSTIYIGSNDTNLYAINPDGTKKWNFTTGGSVISAPAIGLDGTIYVGSSDNNLYAVNPDGTKKWSYATGNIVQSSPAIGTDGTIYVGSNDNNVYAITPSGTLSWSFATGNPVQSSPAVGSDGTIYVGSTDNSLYAIHPNGSLSWTFATNSGIVSSPTIGSNGIIYVGSQDGNIYALNSSGELQWSFYTYSAIYSSPAIGPDGSVYVASGNNLNAFTANGYLEWWNVTAGQTTCSPAVGADGVIYLGDSSGHLWATAPNGWGLWYFLADGALSSSPAIGPNGVIYIGCGDGNVHAIGTEVSSIPISTVSVNPTSVPEGARATGTLTLSAAAPAGGDYVGLISSDPSVSVPPFVVIPGGTTSVSFAINTNAVSVNTTAVITATSGGANATATLTVQTAGLTSLNLNPSMVVGGANSTGSLLLSAPAGPSGTVVSLASSDTGVATVPATVTVPSGATSATFTIKTISSATVQTATISATINGIVATATLTVNPADLASITISPTSVVGGGSPGGTITLAAPAPTGGAVIILASSSLSVVTPTTLSIAAGSSTVTFTAATLGVSATKLVTLTATYGSSLKSCILTLLPSGIESVQVSPSPVVGGSASTVTGTVSLTGEAGPIGAVVKLVSSIPAAATVPTSVTVASGATTASFTVNTLAVPSVRNVVVTASYGGKSVKATLVVDPTTVSSVSVSPNAIAGGSGLTGGVVTLTGPAPTGGCLVGLRSSSANVVLPTSVRVAAGVSSATFTGKTLGVSASTAVTLTATLNGNSASCQVTLLPAQLASLTLSPTTVVGSYQNSVGTVALSGEAGSGGTIVTLSSSAPDVASVPASVTVGRDASTKTFAIKTNAVTSTQVVTITATSNGVSETATLTVNPEGLAIVSVTPTTIVGGNSANGLVTLSVPALAGGAFIALSSSDPSVTVPSSVTILPGARTAKFSVTTSGVDTTTTVTIFASLGETTVLCTVNVVPASASNLKVSPTPASLSSGATITGTITLNGQAGPSGIVVALTSSNTKKATVPTSVFVPAGTFSATFTVTPVAVGVSRIQATANGKSVTASLTIDS